ncbi:MAG: DNA primase DnaG [Candidatus Nanoarchaeia archaeon]|jgi:DNA primase
MGKIAQVSTKYIIHAILKAEGLVDKPDIIGAVFGQTEGLLGKEMELRELQKSGRIGRIDVSPVDKNGKTTARIMVPSSLDKTKTAIIAAAIETIERIGPCNGTINLDKIEDVRVEKRDYIQERAKEILSKFIKDSDDSQELTREVSISVKEAEVITFGPDKLSAGPDVPTSDELIIVEGRADVLALLRAGINNAICVNGTNIPQTIIDLMKTKKVNVACVDGDRGGDLIVKSLKQVGRLDFVAKAPDGKEVEELTDKEIMICLRARGPVVEEKKVFNNNREFKQPYQSNHTQHFKDKEFFNKALTAVEGKSVARLYNQDLTVIGEIPINGIRSVKGVSGVFAIVADAPVNNNLLYFAEDNHAEFLVGTKLETRKRSRVKILTKRTL